jgi:hypothetical protein
MPYPEIASLLNSIYAPMSWEDRQTNKTTAQIAINFLTLFSSKKINNIRFQDVRADVAGEKRGILILTMSTKTTLSFLLLITLSLFVLLLRAYKPIK